MLFSKNNQGQVVPVTHHASSRYTVVDSFPVKPREWRHEDKNLRTSEDDSSAFLPNSEFIASAFVHVFCQLLDVDKMTPKARHIMGTALLIVQARRDEEIKQLVELLEEMSCEEYNWREFETSIQSYFTQVHGKTVVIVITTSSTDAMFLVIRKFWLGVPL